MKMIDISTIPPEVFKAADTLHNYFTRIGATDWECSHVADRRLVVKLDQKLRSIQQAAGNAGCSDWLQKVLATHETTHTSGPSFKA